MRSNSFFFILFLLSLNLRGQVDNFTPQIHLNTRSAKDTSVFDWYYKGQFDVTIDSTYDISAFHNRERDNAKYYYSYGVKIATKYLTLEDFKDTELDKEFMSVKAYFPYRIFKFGYDYSFINHENTHNAFVGLNWRFVNLECSFLREIIKAKYKVNPELNIFKTLYIGFNLEGTCIDKEYKWQSGITTKLKIKGKTK